MKLDWPRSPSARDRDKAAMPASVRNMAPPEAGKSGAAKRAGELSGDHFSRVAVVGVHGHAIEKYAGIIRSFGSASP